jgi:hypothetical protein
MERAGSAVDGHGVGNAHPLGKRALERLCSGSKRKPRAVQDIDDRIDVLRADIVTSKRKCSLRFLRHSGFPLHDGLAWVKPARPTETPHPGQLYVAGAEDPTAVGRTSPAGLRGASGVRKMTSERSRGRRM